MEKENSHCAKGKRADICRSARCFTYNWYTRAGVPCFYYLDKNRGYTGKLKDVAGRKVRRQYFHTLLYLIAAPYLIPIAAIIARTLKNGGNFWDVLGDFMLSVVLLIGLFLPFLLLSLCNAFFFGRVICVLGKDGIYSHGPMIRWQDVESMEFHLGLPSRGHIGCSYVLIKGGGAKAILPHAPSGLLRQAKKYNSAIRTRYEGVKIWPAIGAVAALIVGLLVLLT